MTTLKIKLNDNGLYDMTIDGELVKRNITMDEALAEIAKTETEDNDD